MRMATVSEVQSILQRAWTNNNEVLGRIYAASGEPGAPVVRAEGQGINPSLSAAHNMFFLNTIAVPPNRVRPPSRSGEALLDHPHNVALAQVCPQAL